MVKQTGSFKVTHRPYCKKQTRGIELNPDDFPHKTWLNDRRNWVLQVLAVLLIILLSKLRGGTQQNHPKVCLALHCICGIYDLYIIDVFLD